VTCFENPPAPSPLPHGPLHVEEQWAPRGEGTPEHSLSPILGERMKVRGPVLKIAGSQQRAASSVPPL